MAAEVRIPALRIRQPIGDFYLCVIPYRDVIAISATDTRRLRDSEFDEYIGIQRRLDPSRIRRIKQYVESYDAAFPTSVILAVDDDNAFFDEATNVLSICNDDKSLEDIATIIDGQHRIEGLREYSGENFDLAVAIFIGADMATKAGIFATVNLAQTKVNKSLVYDLLDYERKNSPQKSAHNVSVALDRIEKSPFFKRIKRLGIATEGREKETITQATVVEALLKFISDNPNRDRNASFFGLLRPDVTSTEHQQFPFRELFIHGHEDKITLNVINFFTAVRRKWPRSWDDLGRRGNVLPKTNGFRALMRIFKPLYIISSKGERMAVIDSSAYSEFFDDVNLGDEDFNTENFPAGTSGEVRLYNHLKGALSSQELGHVRLDL